MEVAVLGLGEAGGRLADDLAASGCAVRGWDPAGAREGIVSASSAPSAVRGADVVLSVNSAAVALDAAQSVAADLGADAVFADLNTSSPALKRDLATAVRGCSPTLRSWGRFPCPDSVHRRSRPDRAASGSPSCSDRSGCPSRWSVRARATPPGSSSCAASS